MSYSDDKEYSKSEFYYPGETNAKIYAAERFIAAKVFSGLFYKSQKSHIINPLLIYFSRSIRAVP